MWRHAIIRGGFLAGLPAIIALYALWLAAAALEDARALRDRGVVVQARVASTDTDEEYVHRYNGGSSRRTIYLVTYAFRPPGPDSATAELFFERDVSRHVYESVRSNDQVDLIVDPANPEVFDIHPGDTAWEAAGYLAIAALFAAFTVGILVFFRRHTRTSYMLEQYGLGTDADIEEISAGRQTAYLHLRFVDYKRVHREVFLHNVPAQSLGGLAPGDRLQILYLPTDPTVVGVDWARFAASRE